MSLKTLLVDAEAYVANLRGNLTATVTELEKVVEDDLSEEEAEAHDVLKSALAEGATVIAKIEAAIQKI